MPPRKSNVSTTSNGADEGTEPAPTKSRKDKGPSSVDQLTLPKSMVARLAKGVLPANTNISKDAMTAMHRSATVFVSYIAANTSDNASAGGKKTMMPPDVMAALKDGEFEKFIPKLEAELKKHSDIECNKRNNYRRRVKEDKDKEAGTTNGQGETAHGAEAATFKDGETNGSVEADDEERPAKKRKADGGAVVGGDAANGVEDEEMGSDLDGDEQQEDDDGNDSEVEGEEEEEEEEDDDDDDKEDTAMTEGLNSSRMDNSHVQTHEDQSDSD